MHIYPLYRLNQPVAAIIMIAAAIIGALVAPITMAPTTGSAPMAPPMVMSPALADPAAAAIAAEQHVTLAGRDPALLAAGRTVSKCCAEQPTVRSHLRRDMDRHERR